MKEVNKGKKWVNEKRARRGSAEPNLLRTGGFLYSIKKENKHISKLLLLTISPVILMILVIGLLVAAEMYVVKDQYNLEKKDLDSPFGLLDKARLLDSYTKPEYQEIKDILQSDPERMEDNNVLNELNAKLKDKYSFLILRKGKEFVYIGDERYHNVLEENLPEGEVGFSSRTSKVIYLPQCSLLYKTLNFTDQNGNEGILFIFTDLDVTLPHIKILIYGIISISIIVFFIISFALFRYVYYLWLNALLVEQEENDNITREVITNISHDLKTPLTAIKGYAEGILDGIASSPERVERYVQTIYTKAGDMSLLVDELSFFNNIHQHDVEYNFSVVSANDYFSDCTADLISDLEIKKIHLLFQTYLDQEVMIKIDTDKLKRVVNNIIGNACKYIDHEQGVILVKLRREKEDIIISFEDNGVGIEESELPFIFDRFYRTDSSRNSNTGGTGLGLAIAKKIVTDLGGEIRAESIRGKGTALIIKLKEFNVSEHKS